MLKSESETLIAWRTAESTEKGNAKKKVSDFNKVMRRKKFRTTVNGYL